jgi:Acetyl-coenzyme A synthetase N-terminus/AMP-binding enzyme
MSNPPRPPHEIPTLVPAIGGRGENDNDKNDDGLVALVAYRERYAASLADPDTFWLQQAVDYLSWDKIPTVGCGGDFLHGDVTWFADGTLNVCYNAVDRHVLNGHGDRCALIFEGDEPDDIRNITYAELQRRVCQIANALTSMGVRPDDVVTVYMPMSTFFCYFFLMCPPGGLAGWLQYVGSWLLLSLSLLLFCCFVAAVVAYTCYSSPSQCIMLKLPQTQTPQTNQSRNSP